MKYEGTAKNARGRFFFDQTEAREVGEKAAQYAIWHDLDGSVAIRRVGDYAVEYFLTPLQTVARHAQVMPAKFINKAGNDVTDAFYESGFNPSVSVTEAR